MINLLPEFSAKSLRCSPVSENIQEEKQTLKITFCPSPQTPPSTLDPTSLPPFLSNILLNQALFVYIKLVQPSELNLKWARTHPIILMYFPTLVLPWKFSTYVTTQNLFTSHLHFHLCNNAKFVYFSHLQFHLCNNNKYFALKLPTLKPPASLSPFRCSILAQIIFQPSTKAPKKNCFSKIRFFFTTLAGARNTDMWYSIH